MTDLIIYEWAQIDPKQWKSIIASTTFMRGLPYLREDNFTGIFGTDLAPDLQVVIAQVPRSRPLFNTNPSLRAALSPAQASSSLHSNHDSFLSPSVQIRFKNLMSKTVGYYIRLRLSGLPNRQSRINR